MQRFDSGDEGQNKLDKLFRENLQNFSEKPAPGLWSSISDALDEDKAVVKSKKSNLKYAAVLLLLGFSTIVNIYFNIDWLLNPEFYSSDLHSVSTLADKGDYQKADLFENTQNGESIHFSEDAQGILSPDAPPPVSGSNPIASGLAPVSAIIPENGQENKNPSESTPGKREKRKTERIARQELAENSAEQLERAARLQEVLAITEQFNQELTNGAKSPFETEKETPKKGWFTGTGVQSGQYLLLLKSNSFKGAFGNEITYRFSPSYGGFVQFGYQAKNNTRIESGIWFTHGKSVFLAGQPEAPRSISLEQTQVAIPLAASYSWPVGRKGASMNYLLGLQYNLGLSQRFIENGQTLSVSGGKSDMAGLLFGLEHERILQGILSLNVGVRASLLTPTSDFPLLINEESNKPRQFFVGVHTGIKLLKSKQ